VGTGPATLLPGPSPAVSTKILTGAEPFSAAGGPHGALVLHGFTGSPQSVRGLAHAFVRAGFAVELPRLPGHGTSLEDMATTTWDDWTGAAEEAYRALAARCEQVVVAGLSMGGALTLWLASRYPQIAGIVLVNPLVDAVSLDPARKGARQALDAGEWLIPGVGNDIAKGGIVELAYEGAPAACVISALDGVAKLQPLLAKTHVPLLLAHSLQDHVLPPESRDLLETSYGGPLEVMELKASFHVATLDYDADEIERRSVAFALDVVSSSPSDSTTAR
jgi:carboxylesterase